MTPFGSRYGSERAAPAPQLTTPTACPVCDSASISTAARTPDENAYWRCSTCGEVWNASRRNPRLVIRQR